VRDVALVRFRLTLPLWLAIAADAGGVAMGCAGRAQPTTMRMLETLPDDPVERSEQVDSTQARPGPEQRKGMSSKMRQVETAAATAAAILGSIFSTSPNVLIGVSAPVDENLLFDPTYREKAERMKKRDEDGDGKPDGEADGDDGTPGYDPNQLVPWIRLTPPLSE